MVEKTEGEKKEGKKRDGRGCTYKKRPFQAIYWHARKFTQYAVLLDKVSSKEGKMELKSVAFGHLSAMKEAYANSEQEPNLRYIGDSYGTDRDTLTALITEAMSEALDRAISFLTENGRRRERWIQKKRFFHLADLVEELGYRKGVEHKGNRNRKAKE